MLTERSVIEFFYPVLLEFSLKNFGNVLDNQVKSGEIRLSGEMQ